MVMVLRLFHRVSDIAQKWWPLALWCLAMMAVVGWAADRVLLDRKTAMAQAGFRAQSMADLAAEHVLRTIEGADTALRAVRTRVEDRLDWEALAQDKKS